MPDLLKNETETKPKWYISVMSLSVVFIVVGAIILISGGLIENNDDSDEGEREPSTGAPRDIAYTKIDPTIDERPFTIGRADKDIASLDKVSPAVVPDDETESWFLTMQDSGEPIIYYALSYADTFMNEDETHWFIDTTNVRTTSIYDTGEYLEVFTYEHLQGEEASVGLLGTGVPLDAYYIYKDNGDIVDPEGREEVGDSEDDEEINDSEA